MRIESGRMYVGGAALCNMHLKLMHDRNATTLKKSTEPDLLHYRSTIDMDTLLSQMDKCAMCMQFTNVRKLFQKGLQDCLDWNRPLLY